MDAKPEEWSMIVSLGAALEASILEHEYCGALDGGVESGRVWMTGRAGGDRSAVVE